MTRSLAGVMLLAAAWAMCGCAGRPALTPVPVRCAVPAEPDPAMLEKQAGPTFRERYEALLDSEGPIGELLAELVADADLVANRLAQCQRYARDAASLRTR